jgi:hypothetical protein
MTSLRLGLAGLAASFVVIAAACREPTAILVQLSTDLPCSEVAKAGGAVLLVGSAGTVESSPSTSVVSTTCDNGDLGTIIVVPSGDDDQVAILAEVGSGVKPSLPTLKTAECKPSAPGNCLVTKRVVSYITHNTLKLPIRLSSACAGVVCSNPSETCVDGECVSVVPECTAADGCKPTPPPIDAGPNLDAGPVLDAGIVDANVPDGCAKCGGSTCADLSTDPSNCGACGLKCSTGACVKGICKLSTPILPTTSACIAVDGDVVAFTAGFAVSGGAYWVPRNGSNNATKLDAFSAPGWVAAGKGFTVSGQNGTVAAYRDYASGTPPTPAGALTGVGSTASEINGLARNGNADRCLSFRDGNVHYAACGKFAKQLTGTSGPIAVGSSGWAELVNPTISSAAILPGDFVGTSSPTLDLAKARTVALPRNGNQLYAAVASTILAYVNAAWNTVWSGSLPVRAMRADDKGALYFFEGAPNAGNIRKLTFTGAQIQPNQAPILYTGPMDLQNGESGCLDVDDVAFYFMAGGAPFRGPK